MAVEDYGLPEPEIFDLSDLSETELLPEPEIFDLSDLSETEALPDLLPEPDLDPDIDDFLPPEKGALGEMKEFGQTAVQSLPNYLYGVWDPTEMGKGERLVDLTRSDDFGDQLTTAVVEGVTKAGIVYGATTGGALAGGAIGGAPTLGIGAIPGAAVGGLAAGTTAAVGLTIRGIQRELSGIREETRQKIMELRGTEATEEELDDAVGWTSLARWTTIGGESLDTLWAVATAGAGQAIKTTAMATVATGKELFKSGVAQTTKNLGEKIVADQATRLRAEMTKQAVTRLGMASQAFKTGGQAAILEGVGETVQGAGGRATAEAVARNEDSAIPRLGEQMFSEEGARDFALGSLTQGIIRGTKGGVNAYRTRARQQGGDIAGATDPSLQASQDSSAVDEGLSVAERLADQKPTETDRKAVILNKVATDLEDVGVKQDFAIIPADFADTATIQSALSASKNLQVEALDDGSTKITHLSEVDTNYEAALKEQARKQDDQVRQLKSVQKQKAEIIEAQERTERLLTRAQTTYRDLEARREAVNRDTTKDPELDAQITKASSEITRLQKERDQGRASDSGQMQNLASLERAEKILLANTEGYKKIQDSPDELNELDTELQLVQAKKQRLEDSVSSVETKIEERKQSIAEVEQQYTPTLDSRVEARLDQQREAEYDALEALENGRKGLVSSQSQLRQKLDIKEQEIVDRIGDQQFEASEGTDTAAADLRTARAQERALLQEKANITKALQAKEEQLTRLANDLAKIKPNTPLSDAQKAKQAKLQQATRERNQLETDLERFESFSETELPAVRERQQQFTTAIDRRNLESVRQQRTRLDKELAKANKDIESKEAQILRIERQKVPTISDAKRAQLDERILTLQGQITDLQTNRDDRAKALAPDLAKLTSREQVLNERIDSLLIDDEAGLLGEGKEMLSYGERLQLATNLRAVANDLKADRERRGIKTPPLAIPGDKNPLTKTPEERAAKVEADAESVTSTESINQQREALKNTTRKGVPNYAWVQLKNYMKLKLTANRALPQDFVRVKDEGLGRIALDNKRTLENLQELKEQSKGLGDVYNDALLNEALGGNPIAMEMIPAEIRPQVEKMRDDIDRGARELADLIEPTDPELANLLRSREGTYLNRNYEIFTDPNWINKIQLNEAAMAEADKVFDGNRAALLGYLEDLKESSDMIGAMRNAKTGKRSVGILQQRQEIPEALRFVMGEVKQGPENYLQTRLKQANLIAQTESLIQIKELGLALGVFGTEQQGDFSVQLATEGSETLSPLGSVWMSPEMRRALTEYDSSILNYTPTWFRTGLAASGLAKKAATVWSVSGQSRNFVGNFGFLAANGYFTDPATRGTLGQALREGGVARALFMNVSEQTDAKLEKMLRLNLATSAQVDELNTMGLNRAAGSALEGNIKTFLDQYQGAVAQKMRQAAGALDFVDTKTEQLYQAGDAFFKFMVFDLESTRMRQDPRYAQLTEDAFDKKVAERVRSIMPDYSKASKFVKAFSAQPFIGNFIMFADQAARTYKNTLVTAAGELQSTSSATKTTGAHRMLSALGTPFVMSAVAGAIKYIQGEDEEEADALRRFARPWDANGALVRVGTEDGDPILININTLNPYKNITAAATAFWMNDNIREDRGVKGVIFTSLGELFDAATGAGIFTTKALEAFTNQIDGKDYKPVYPNDADIDEQIIAGTKHILSAFTPATLRTLDNWWKGAWEETDKEGNPYSMRGETLGFFGARPSRLDMSKAVEYKGKNYKTNSDQVTVPLSSLMTRPGTVKPWEIKTAYKNLLSSKDRTNQVLLRDIAAAQKLGLEDDDIRRQLKDANIKKADIERLMNGETPEVTFSKEKLAEIRAIDGREEMFEEAIGLEITDVIATDRDDD